VTSLLGRRWFFLAAALLGLMALVVWAMGQREGNRSILKRAAPQAPAQPLGAPAAEAELPPAALTVRRVDFSHLDIMYRFSAELPSLWQVEPVPASQALNVYDPAAPGEGSLEQSQLFLRTFTADRFLTLPTVTIHEREATTVRGHEAVRYEIEKLPSVPDFPHQPTWRSRRHRLMDVRFSTQRPTVFYVLAYNPALPADVFNAFLESLRFHNDTESWPPPLDRAAERVTKKLFGLEVSPERSPVSPERFAGFHTGVDFEVFDQERSADVEVRAVCGGPLVVTRQASGYGGVAVQECLRGDEPVTMVYGHLRLSSVQASVGQYLAPGDRLGLLGADGTAETDGERRHLHLGVHRGRAVDLRGYVGRRDELGTWLDPLPLFNRPGPGSL
jgi:murein DD-endopeptidase MepM/ murein hydrolase activator NlpD